MNPDRLLSAFGKLNVWSANGQRAPNKPLLALWAIGRCLEHEARMTSYREVDKPLGKLLRDFGPYRRVIHTDFPFWRLRNDHVWELEGAAHVRVNKSGDAFRRDLLDQEVRGGFPKEIYDTLAGDSALALRIARSLVEAHFPWTHHDDILRAVDVEAHFQATQYDEIHRVVDIDPGFVQARRRRRDAGFSKRVLCAYNYRCAVCSFAVELNSKSIALDAAHIKWHQFRGPADVRNGIALCALHHRLFDAGAFTLYSRESLRRPSPTYSRQRRTASLEGQVAENGPMTTSDLQPPIVVVATPVSGRGLDEVLGRFDGQPVHIPADVKDWPDPKHLKWHTHEVFRSPDIIPTAMDDGVRTLRWPV